MEVLLLIIIVVLLIGFLVTIYLLRRHYMMKLRREVYRAHKSEQIKSVFLDNISHTLRTPVDAILGYSELILEQDDEGMQPAHVKEMANYIKQNTEQLRDYVRQLLHLSGFEGGMPSFTFIEVNLAELIASYRRETMNLTNSRVAVRVKTDLSPHCKVTLDTNFMHQLMMHLLSNAARHTMQGDITIKYGSERGGLRVNISYIGSGQSELISEDIISFLQKEDALKLKSETTELALPICRAIVDALGGELDIDSEGNGKKTVATFWFPCRMRDRNKKM